MLQHSVEGCRVLVIEDEYYLADDLRTELDDAGAIVIGPAGSVEDAMDLIASQSHLDAAVVDMNLGGEPASPVIDTLLERSVFVVLSTGYDEDAIPERFRHLPRCEKPIRIGRLTTILGEAF
ncbi:response regulator [Sphingomonas desiccabilis]|uniref:Response regulator n=1 Tax=Sphingomonas desiccabilis TaxID=429134 RepID=A0A4Q2IWD8_9SPHN|nr:response regulator [Sphingomonas desiccabilis]MBB3910257.1 DNA-binding NtrC family response regulator [Sphingomonas desiccabilis]RXZ34925.1 response regulator [Sphingomonas desiccabilis]